MNRTYFLVLIGFFSGICCTAQQHYTRALLKADKLYITHEYKLAVTYYVKYLASHPRDYFAARQAALCYEKLNDPGNAIDYWPQVVESSEASEQDYLSYALSLLANDRIPEARKVFMLLAASENKGLAEWGKVYRNKNSFYEDSANTRVTEVRVLSDRYSESCPYLTGGKLLFMRDRSFSYKTFTAIRDRGTDFITAYTRNDDLAFTETDLYNGFLRLPMYGQFCFSPDGSLLYFCKPVSNAEAAFPSPYSFNKFQLFVLNMSTLNSAVPEIKPFKYNSMLYDFMHPVLSSDGLRLYFASDMKGSMGGKDIFVCEWSGSDWDEPVNVGAEVNSEGHEVYPYLAMDGRLYFSSNFRPGLGGLDLFSAPASKVPGRMFEKAQNIGANLNSRYDDFGITFIYGGNAGYLSSNRKNGSDNDIFHFTISK